jgi:hypothetical protein
MSSIKSRSAIWLICIKNILKASKVSEVSKVSVLALP